MKLMGDDGGSQVCCSPAIHHKSLLMIANCRSECQGRVKAVPLDRRSSQMPSGSCTKLFLLSLWRLVYATEPFQYKIATALQCNLVHSCTVHTYNKYWPQESRHPPVQAHGSSSLRRQTSSPCIYWLLLSHLACDLASPPSTAASPIFYLLFNNLYGVSYLYLGTCISLPDLCKCFQGSSLHYLAYSGRLFLCPYFRS